MLRAELISKSITRKIIYPDVLMIGRKGEDLVVTYRKDGQVMKDTYLRSDIYRYTTSVVPDKVEEEQTNTEDPSEVVTPDEC